MDTEERREVDERAQQVKTLGQRIAVVKAGVARTEDKIKGMAAGSVRAEVFGLLLVGAGSVISAIAAVLGCQQSGGVRAPSSRATLDALNHQPCPGGPASAYEPQVLSHHNRTPV